MLLIKKCWNKTKNGESTNLTLKISNTLMGRTTNQSSTFTNEDDDDDGEIVTFKQVRYTVKTDFKVVSL